MFSVVHWNCNSVNNKVSALKSFSSEQSPCLVSLNETKTNKNIIIDNYEPNQKNRDNKGGGVAFLVNKNINFIENNTLDKYNLELKCLDVTFNNEKITFISWYLPALAKFPTKEFFDDLNKLEKFILIGDLNCN
jgi:exonuclease III